jgi:superfamily II DNA or RNA helicase
MLSDLDFPPEMSKGADDIAADFYLPCMRAAIKYDRVAGFFSSAAYLIAWPAIRAFFSRGGRIRVICSPALSESDVEGLTSGYGARMDEALSEALIAELNAMLASDQLERPARALSGMIAAGLVDVRLALLSKGAPPVAKRIFHDKVGIFEDESGMRVGFRGTMNETYLGLAPDGNIDSIDIFPSWVGGRDERRVVDAVGRFEALWSNEIEGIQVRPFPDVALKVIREVAAQAAWEILAEQLAVEALAEAEALIRTAPASVRPLWPHQVEALAAWEANGNRGILAHVTGSGKTLTAIEAIRRRLRAGEAPLVVVPSTALLRQWALEITRELADLEPRLLFCGGGNDSWRTGGLLRMWLRRAAEERRVVLAVLNTASSAEFLAGIPTVPLFLLSDEVHRVGSRAFSGLLTIEANSRLGLSATPERYGDPSGTDAVMTYFSGVVHTYTLQEAIAAGHLTPYTYHPATVSLTADETDRWRELTRRIGLRAAAVADQGDLAADERLRLLLIERARIAKNAAAKVDHAAEILTAHCETGHRWLVYCDSLAQLGDVMEALRRRGLHPLEYHSAMTGDEAATLNEFELNGGVIASIRCLDEGVNIPSASHALILASSRNPREFVQRRGRVLRPHPTKTVSHIYDALVVPGTRVGDTDDGFVWGELARAVQFSRSALNAEAHTALERVCIDQGLDVSRLASLGFEDDEEVD